MSLRKYVLDAAFERVTRGAGLRRPQYEALDAFHRLIFDLADDLPNLTSSDVARRLHELRPEWHVDEFAPHLAFALATGVGKSRLMAALLAYLALAGESRNFLLL